MSAFVPSNPFVPCFPCKPPKLECFPAAAVFVGVVDSGLMPAVPPGVGVAWFSFHRRSKFAASFPALYL